MAGVAITTVVVRRCRRCTVARDERDSSNLFVPRETILVREMGS